MLTKKNEMLTNTLTHKHTNTHYLECDLVADLDPAARDKGHAPLHVCSLKALAEIQTCTGRAERIVEMMQLSSFAGF